MADLEALFRQVSDAERRAQESERGINELRRLRDELAQTKALLSRATADLAEQHRQARLRPPPAPPRPQPSPPAPPKTQTSADAGQRPVGGASSASPSRPSDRKGNLPAVAKELRRLYRRLQAHHSAGPVSDAENRRWTEELSAYDKALLSACRVLGVATGSRPGESLQAGERVELTRKLASAGLDVRVEDLSASR